MRSQKNTKDKSVTGTLDYAPPEQTGELDTPVGPYSDVYAFGKTFIRLLFRVPTANERLWKTLPDDVRGPLRLLLENCVEYYPNDRLPNFDPVLKTLAELDPAEKANRERLEREAAERKRRAEEAEQQAQQRAREQEAADRQRAERVRLAAEVAEKANRDRQWCCEAASAARRAKKLELQRSGTPATRRAAKRWSESGATRRPHDGRPKKEAKGQRPAPPRTRAESEGENFHLPVGRSQDRWVLRIWWYHARRVHHVRVVPTRFVPDGERPPARTNQRETGSLGDAHQGFLYGHSPGDVKGRNGKS